MVLEDWAGLLGGLAVIGPRPHLFSVSLMRAKMPGEADTHEQGRSFGNIVPSRWQQRWQQARQPHLQTSAISALTPCGTTAEEVGLTVLRTVVSRPDLSVFDTDVPARLKPRSAFLRNARGSEREGASTASDHRSTPGCSNGGGGIRTHESLRTPVFKTGALNHSATPPPGRSPGAVRCPVSCEASTALCELGCARSA